jgi:hypothetical protein
MVDSFAYWAIAIATIAGLGYLVLGIFQWLRAQHPERLRIGERLPKAIATAADLPNAREIHREYCVTLLKKNAVSNTVISVAVILASSFAFLSLPPLKAALAQISAVSGEDPISFENLPLLLLGGVAVIFVAVCSSAGPLLAIASLPKQRERHENNSDQIVGGLSWRVVIVFFAPTMFLFVVTFVYALSPTATSVYPPHIVAVNELRSRYPWMPFAIPIALLVCALVSGFCIWSLQRLAPRRLVSEASVSASVDWSNRHETIRHSVDDWQKLLYFPGFIQFMLLPQLTIPVFVGISTGSFLIFLLPLLLWFAWCMFLAERLLRRPATLANTTSVESALGCGGRSYVCDVWGLA